VRISGILLLTAVMVSVGCEKQPPPAIVTPVRVEQAQLLSDDIQLSYSAQVIPQTQVDLAFRTDGYIDEILLVPGVDGAERLLQPGDSVKGGDVLARVKDEQYRDKVATAQANLDKARAALVKGEQDFKRADALNKTQSITAPDFDAAQKEYATALAAVDGARAQLDEANLKLSDTALVTPMDGTIQQRNIELGTLVHAGSVGFVIANTSVVKVVFGVPDVMLSRVKLGSELEIHTDSLPNRKFAGVVTEITPAADQRTRIFEVSVTVDNADGALRPGMVAALDVNESMMPAGEVTVVPIGAVVQDSSGGFAVFIAETNKGESIARLRPVTTGQLLGNSIAISEGLEAGDLVIVTGTAQISDNQPVNIVP
jgi:RND family efflux transporter MFP subunit